MPLTREETLMHREASTRADAVLRSDQKLDEGERKLMREGAAWERDMQRIFKGIITRKQRRDALRRAVGR